uniref:Phosphatidylinositol-4-phosphate 5-kinase like 1 n=1 Tax=Seriola dumerili TaxID=41447 RepID=A0A3B4VCG8_SERDU
METSAAAGGVGRMSGHHQRSVKRRRWGGLRQQWKLLGLFEIDQQHEFYGLTCMMKEGLAAAIQSTIDNAPINEVSDDDFRLEVTQIHKDFTMETFAGPVFASLRGSLGMTEQEYQKSLCSENCYLQFISNSKSKADFFLTNDKRFFLKTQNKREIKFLLSNLKIYMEHLRKYPHSLLNLVCSTCPLQKYFIVMQSVFYPDDRINARYDIKGCEVSRWTDPSPEGSQIIVVLKDLNFEGQYITLGKEDDAILLLSEIDGTCLKQPRAGDASSGSTLQVCPKHAGPGNDATELSDFKAQNRRLLPNLKNPLHIIDGPEQRYFIGIIDIFTVYSFKKRLEHLWKRLRHPGRSFSTVSPQTYCLRLCQWVQDHTK